VRIGTVGIGLSATKTFTIKNTGKANLIGSATLRFDDSSQAGVYVVSPATFNLAPRGSQIETVTFRPDASSDIASILIASNDETRPLISVVLDGNGAPGKLSVPRTFKIVGSVEHPIQTNLTIKNVGKGLLSGEWEPVTLAPYSVAGGFFGPLQPGATALIPITFTPSAKGAAPIVDLPIIVDSPSTGDLPVALRGIGK
jgi:hypothetical protein